MRITDGNCLVFREVDAKRINRGFVIIVNSRLIMKYDLEQRLINYGVMILEIAESLPESKGSAHLVNQIVRSGKVKS